MKILIADKLSEKAVKELGEMGMDVEFRPELGADDLPASVGESEILVVRSTKVTAATIEAGGNLSLIIRAGAGVNTIDLTAANNRGIYVANCPGKNCDAVAELVIGLMIAADRRIVDASCALRDGKWQKKAFQKARGLKGRTLGIVGLGMIGWAVAHRAKGMQMEVLVWSRSLTPEKAAQLGVGYAVSPLEVAEKADVVSLNIAANAETKHLVNKEFLDAMKDGAILVNAARGEVVDTEALKIAINSKGIRAAMDVFENEPAGGEAAFEQTELAAAVTCTPHIGASTDQAAEAIADETVRIVRTFSENGIPANAVNLCAHSPAKYSLVVRHYNRVGVLAGVLDGLREDGVNVQEMQNIIFEEAEAACCSLFLDRAPSEKTLSAISQDESVLSVSVQKRDG